MLWQTLVQGSYSTPAFQVSLVEVKSDDRGDPDPPVNVKWNREFKDTLGNKEGTYLKKSLRGGRSSTSPSVHSRLRFSLTSSVLTPFWDTSCRQLAEEGGVGRQGRLGVLPVFLRPVGRTTPQWDKPRPSHPPRWVSGRTHRDDGESHSSLWDRRWAEGCNWDP